MIYYCLLSVGVPIRYQLKRLSSLLLGVIIYLGRVVSRVPEDVWIGANQGRAKCEV